MYSRPYIALLMLHPVFLILIPNLGSVQAPTERNGLPHGGAPMVLAPLGNSRDSAVFPLNLDRHSAARCSSVRLAGLLHTVWVCTARYLRLNTSEADFSLHRVVFSIRCADEIYAVIVPANQVHSS